MKLTIDAGVFQSANSPALNTLGYYAIKGQHRIEILEDRDPQFVEWLDELGRNERLLWDDVVSQSYLLEAKGPAARTAKIAAVEKSSWDARDPVVTLADAVDLLSQPFRILVEDGITDRSFILRMLDDLQRDALLAMERSRVIEFRHAGGITSMKNIIAGFREKPWEPHLHWVLFDSDAQEPGLPSSQSTQVAQSCASLEVPFHQLCRRNIENYLTKDALRGWAFAARRRERRAVLSAYISMSSEQRAHYSLKDGFRNKQHSKALYANLTAEQRTSLEAGFSQTISHLYRDESVTRDHLRREGVLDEMQPVIGSLFALIR